VLLRFSVWPTILDTSVERVAKDIATYQAIVKSFRLDPLAHYQVLPR
jgi:hypothetical protein